MNEEYGFWDKRKADWNQLKYLVKHKKDVYSAGRELGAPRLQLLMHDRTKFSPNNWAPYRDYWFGPDGYYEGANKDRSKIPQKLKEPFRDAANRHYKSEDHHLHKPPRNKDFSNISENVKKEMIADWYSVNKHVKGGNVPPVNEWIKKNKIDILKKLDNGNSN